MSMKWVMVLALHGQAFACRVYVWLSRLDTYESHRCMSNSMEVAYPWSQKIKKDI
jgi:hypothetical protein